MNAVAVRLNAVDVVDAMARDPLEDFSEPASEHDTQEQLVYGDGGVAHEVDDDDDIDVALQDPDQEYDSETPFAQSYAEDEDGLFYFHDHADDVSGSIFGSSESDDERSVVNSHTSLQQRELDDDDAFAYDGDDDGSEESRYTIDDAEGSDPLSEASGDQVELTRAAQFCQLVQELSSDTRRGPAFYQLALRRLRNDRLRRSRVHPVDPEESDRDHNLVELFEDENIRRESADQSPQEEHVLSQDTRLLCDCLLPTTSCARCRRRQKQEMTEAMGASPQVVSGCRRGLEEELFVHEDLMTSQQPERYTVSRHVESMAINQPHTLDSLLQLQRVASQAHEAQRIDRADPLVPSAPQGVERQWQRRALQALRNERLEHRSPSLRPRVQDALVRRTPRGAGESSPSSSSTASFASLTKPQD
ncbi:hypothetical protein PINS_up010097 [Pythium insidiosum]|nr:hypothetical protein PINS_up010097 [Pythium insidiosum]